MKNKERSTQTLYMMSSKASKNKGEASNEKFDEDFQKMVRLSCYDDSAQTETRHVLLGTRPHQFASKNNIATRDNLCSQIENNFDFVKVLACFGKCGNASPARNVNIKITNNFNVVMICQNFTFDILPNELKGQLKSKLKNGEATTREERLFFPWKEHKDDPETFSSAENIHPTGRNFVYTRRRFDGFSMASSKNDDFTRISEKPASVKSDGSTKEKAKINQNVPTCTLSTEADFKSCVARENSPLQIESNFGIVIIVVCGKCNNDFAEDSKGPALENPPENVNINITKNNGDVMVCQNGHFNVHVRPDTAIEKMERKVQDIDVSLERREMVISEQEVEERHLFLDENNTKQVGILSASSGDCGNVYNCSNNLYL